MLNGSLKFKEINNLSREVKLGMKKDENKFDELQNIKPNVQLEVRKLNC